MKKTGIIGCGGRGVRNLGSKFVQAKNLGLEVVALSDNLSSRLPEAADILNRAAQEINAPGRRYNLYADWREMLEKEALDMVVITTPQCCHQEPFEVALSKGLKVYCDKPMAHTSDAVRSMFEVWNKNGRRNAILGFTRRYEKAWRDAYKIVEQGDVGEVKMILLRSVIPYSVYFHRWHSNSQMSGGIINEKSSHHLDVMQWFAGSRAAMVSAMGGRNIYMPREDHPGFCHRCDEECEFRFNDASITQDNGLVAFPSTVNSEDTRYANDRCVFDPDADIIDHAIVNVSYANNVKAQLFLDIAGFSTDDQETLEIVGSRGKLQLERHSAKLKVFRDYGRDIEEIDCRDENHERSHFGADDFLIQQIADMAHDKLDNPPVGPLEGTMATITACLATQSCRTMEVYPTDFDRL